jgi:hypothetical protein
VESTIGAIHINTTDYNGSPDDASHRIDENGRVGFRKRDHVDDNVQTKSRDPVAQRR